MHPELSKIWQEKEVEDFFSHLLFQNEELAQYTLGTKEGKALLAAIGLMAILAAYYNDSSDRPAATMGHLLATVELATGPQLRHLIRQRPISQERSGEFDKTVVKALRKSATNPLIQQMALELTADLTIGEQERAVVLRHLVTIPDADY